MKDTAFYREFSLNLSGKIINFDSPVIMGVLNMTPDSFYDGEKNRTLAMALESATQFITEGADIIDIGGYSSRPGAKDIVEEDEIARIIPLIKEIKERFPLSILSVDTFRSNVAEQAIIAGADIINDISGGLIDPKIYTIAAKYSVPYILMHTRGTPQNMKTLSKYTNVTKEVVSELSERIAEARNMGVKDIIIDPGFGFAKDMAQNFELFSNLELLHALELPLLVGISRKSMIYKTLNKNPDDALIGTTVLNTIALERGAQLLRVHDVKEAVEVRTLFEKIIR